MNFVAWKMLVGDRAKYIGIIVGLTFASLLITQQAAIFVGLMSRTYGAITDLGLPDIWVMDKKVQFIDDVKPLQDTQLYRVRGIKGVDWAVPLYKGLLKARLDNGNFQTCQVVGLDDATLIGGPPEMVEGKLEDLRRADSVIVDIVGAQDKLAHQETPTSRPIPLKIGDVLELNDHRATVVGTCRVGRTFQSQPVVYTTYSRATTFAPRERKLLSFVLVKAKPGVDPNELCRRIESVTGLAAYTQKGFKDLTFWYFFKYTGIPINFGISVALGFIVGTAIAGQTFYNFTLDNLKLFGTLKAMGASNGTLLRMIILQAITVGAIGYGLGVGLASLSGAASAKSELAFLLPWQLLLITAGAVTVICVMSSLISIRKVIKLEPAIVFKS
ncbi:MAG TPA: ABC transporter permease [Tepidisphaeraceae bacterium]|jgi:putative ABC transport system permease protein|nr:ABC transporter permease [Tepidisphaeraceae bacterium]